MSRETFNFWIGVAGFAVGVVGIALAFYFYYHPKAGPPSATDKFVERTNPVTLDISHVELKQWLGDSAKSLTIFIKNTARVPVDNVTALVNAGGKVLPAYKSAAFANVNMNSISIQAGKVLQLPVASAQTLQDMLSGHVCSAGMHPIGGAYPMPKTCQGTSAWHSYMLSVVVTYNTIFGKDQQTEAWFWVSTCAECDAR